MNISLLDFSDIQKKLDKLFSEIPNEICSELSDLKLKQSTLSEDNLFKVESVLQISLPNTFRQLILKYDFGDLTLGGVWFGNKENYDKYLIKVNTDRVKDKQRKIYFSSWWGADKRPENCIMVGASDGYVVLLNTATEEILSYPRIKSYKSVKVIASNFKDFVRAVATVYVLIQNKVDEQILTEIPLMIGSNIDNCFWREIISVYNET